MSEVSREEYLDWAKARAMEYVERGEFALAISSISSDLNKREDTRGDGTIYMLGMQMLLSGHLDSREEMEKFIQGFN